MLQKFTLLIPLLNSCSLQVKIWFQNRRMKLKKELRAVKEINEQVRREREEQEKQKQKDDDKKKTSDGASPGAASTPMSNGGATAAPTAAPTGGGGGGLPESKQPVT